MVAEYRPKFLKTRNSRMINESAATFVFKSSISYAKHALLFQRPNNKKILFSHSKRAFDFKQNKSIYRPNIHNFFDLINSIRMQFTHCKIIHQKIKLSKKPPKK